MDGGELDYFHLAHAARNRDAYGIAHLLIQEAAADRRDRGNQTVGNIHIFTGHQFVTYFFVFVDVQHYYDRSQPDAVMRDLGHVDHRDVAQAGVQLSQAGVDERLTLLGRMILSVFTEIPVGPRFQNLPRKLDPELVFEHRDLVLE